MERHFKPYRQLCGAYTYCSFETNGEQLTIQISDAFLGSVLNASGKLWKGLSRTLQAIGEIYA